jgi:hypothetical protein
MIVKARRAAAFLSWYISKPSSLRTGLVLPYMLGLDVISFSISKFLLFFWFSKKKNIGEKMQNFFLLLIAFKIFHVFLPDIPVHCALIKYAYI